MSTRAANRVPFQQFLDVHGRPVLAFLRAMVGPDEADIDQGLISVTSPLGRALLGKEEGDEVNFVAPGGKRTYEIEKVEYKEIIIK